MTRLIDADSLEADCNIYDCWDAQIVKEWLNDQPTVEAIPIEFVKGELKHLKYMLFTADPDDVDSIWDLKAKIEALEDLLKEWEEKNETDRCGRLHVSVLGGRHNGKMLAMGLVAEAVEKLIAEAPTVEAEPVRHGYWTRIVKQGYAQDWFCSVCGETGRSDYAWCPRCGARMDKETEG